MRCGLYRAPAIDVDNDDDCLEFSFVRAGLTNVHILLGIAVNDAYADRRRNGAAGQYTVYPGSRPRGPNLGGETREPAGQQSSVWSGGSAFHTLPAGSGQPQLRGNLRSGADATIQSLINQGDAADAGEVAGALDYALYHDNHGDYLSTAPGNRQRLLLRRAGHECGLHDAYESGDIALFNDQYSGTGTGKAGDSRLAGFSCGSGVDFLMRHSGHGHRRQQRLGAAGSAG